MNETYESLSYMERQKLISQISDLMRLDKFTFDQIVWMIEERGIKRGLLPYSYGLETTENKAGCELPVNY